MYYRSRRRWVFPISFAMKHGHVCNRSEGSWLSGERCSHFVLIRCAVVCSGNYYLCFVTLSDGFYVTFQMFQVFVVSVLGDFVTPWHIEHTCLDTAGSFVSLCLTDLAWERHSEGRFLRCQKLIHLQNRGFTITPPNIFCRWLLSRFSVSLAQQSFSWWHERRIQLNTHRKRRSLHLHPCFPGPTWMSEERSLVQASGTEVVGNVRWILWHLHW